MPGMHHWSRCKREGVHAGLFPAEAGPTKSTVHPGRTGFSRESVSGHAANVWVLMPASSRLKPVPLKAQCIPVGLALAGKASGVTPQM